MARNRKRAKERRARRADAPVSRSRVAAAPAEATPDPLAESAPDPLAESAPDPLAESAPDPLEHAAPDVELADAQVALGRARFDAETPGSAELEEEEPFEAEPELEVAAGEDRGNGRGNPPPPEVALGRGGGAGMPSRGGAVSAEARVSLLARLIGFLQGSWRELQRVQWPDRRQVAQATSVVIGFVIVAGVFLGLADLAFSHLMNYVLYGK